MNRSDLQREIDLALAEDDVPKAKKLMEELRAMPEAPATDLSSLATIMARELAAAMTNAPAPPGTDVLRRCQAREDIIRTIPVARVRSCLAEVDHYSAHLGETFPIRMRLHVQENPILTPEQVEASGAVPDPKWMPGEWKIMRGEPLDLSPLENAAIAHVKQQMHASFEEAARKGDTLKLQELDQLARRPNPGNGLVGSKHVVWEARRDALPLFIGKVLNRLPAIVRLLPEDALAAE